MFSNQIKTRHLLIPSRKANKLLDYSFISVGAPCTKINSLVVVSSAYPYCKDGGQHDDHARPSPFSFGVTDTSSTTFIHQHPLYVSHSSRQKGLCSICWSHTFMTYNNPLSMAILLKYTSSSSPPAVTAVQFLPRPRNWHAYCGVASVDTTSSSRRTHHDSVHQP